MKEKIKRQLLDYYRTDKKYFDNLNKHFYKNINKYTSYLKEKYFKDKKILDAGCGSGVMVDWISKRFDAEVSGIDLSPYAIKKAKKRYKGKFFCGDLEKTNFKENSFDTILLFDVLEHIVYPKKVFRELKRILKPKGNIIIISPNMIFSKHVPIKLKIIEVIDTLVLPLQKKVRLNYINPDTSECACGDREACLITNPFKIRKILRKEGFRIDKGNPIRCIIFAKKTA